MTDTKYNLYVTVMSNNNYLCVRYVNCKCNILEVACSTIGLLITDILLPVLFSFENGLKLNVFFPIVQSHKNSMQQGEK